MNNNIMYNPPHPGEILHDCYFPNLEITITEWALNMGISRSNLSKILNAKMDITAETSLKFGKSLNLQPDFLLKLQTQYDIFKAKQKVNLDKVIKLLPKNNIDPPEKLYN